MKIQHLTTKILTGSTTILLLAVLVMGIRIQADAKRLQSIKDSLEKNPVNDELNALQRTLSEKREGILQKVAHAPSTAITEEVTTTTVVPGKVVEVKRTVTAPSKKTQTS